MDLRDSPREASFREEVRAFLRKEAPRLDGESKVFIDYTFDLEVLGRYSEWFRKLGERRWIATHWPEEYGGGGLSPVEQLILHEEMALAHAPRPFHLTIALGVAGPTILAYGNEDQKRLYLPRVASGEDIWCQGYSEPNAGSDLGSLQTRAVSDGGAFIINGLKIWTSFAHQARWMILLARTDQDAPKHKGITCFIVDMKDQGVSLQPLVNMIGTHEFNQVFFDNVRVPKENIIGSLNEGWQVAVKSLDFERSFLGSAIGLRQIVEGLIQFAKEQAHNGASTLGTNSSIRQELIERYMEAEVARILSFRVASLQSQGQIPNHEASVNKVFTMELQQRISRTGMKLLGLYGQLGERSPWVQLAGRIYYMYLRSTANTIEGGASEVQRNIIAQRGLGLPRG